MSSFSFNINANLASLEADLKKLFGKYATLNTGFNSSTIRNINSVVNNVNQGFSQAGQNFINNMKAANKEASIGIEKLLKGTAKVSKGFEGIVKISRNIQGFGDPRMLSGAFDGIGDSLKSLGKGAKQFSNMLRASAAQSSGVKKGILTMASKGTAALGPMLSIVGSLAGAFASVLAVMIDAEAQAKGMNKQFFEAGTSLSDLGGSIGNVKDKMKEARDAAMSWNTMMNFGASIEQQQSLINTLNKTGVTLQFLSKSAGGAVKTASSFQDIMKVSLVYAKNAGVSMEEVASHQGYLMSELGQSLKTVEQGFTSLYQASMSAGFGTARFFTQVQQATSGLAMYNVRTEQTAGLMVMLSKVLSPESAGRFLQSLTKGFGDLNYQERFKKIKIAGEKVTQDIFEVEAKKSGESFLKNFGIQGKDQKYLDEVKQTVGLDLTQGTDALLKQLSGLSDKEAAAKVAQARLVDPTGALSKELSKLIELNRGASGNMEDMTKGLDQLGPGGVLAMQMSQNIGGLLKPFHERSMVELMATESFAGYSGEQLLEMRKISETLYGNYDQAKIMAEKMGGMTKGSKEYIDANNKMAESFGLALDENGNMVQAAFSKGADGEPLLALGTEVKDIQGYIVTQGDAFENIATEETVDKQTALAMETAKATTTMADIMEFGVKYFLEQIYGLLGGLGDILIDFYNWVTGTSKDGVKSDTALIGREETKALQADYKKQIDAANERISAADKEISQKTIEMNTLSGEKRADKKREIEALEAQKKGDISKVGKLKESAMKYQAGSMTVGEMKKEVQVDKAKMLGEQLGGDEGKALTDAILAQAGGDTTELAALVAEVEKKMSTGKYGKDVGRIMAASDTVELSATTSAQQSTDFADRYARNDLGGPAANAFGGIPYLGAMAEGIKDIPLVGGMLDSGLSDAGMLGAQALGIAATDEEVYAQQQKAAQLQLENAEVFKLATQDLAKIAAGEQVGSHVFEGTLTERQGAMYQNITGSVAQARLESEKVVNKEAIQRGLVSGTDEYGRQVLNPKVSEQIGGGTSITELEDFLVQKATKQLQEAGAFEGDLGDVKARISQLLPELTSAYLLEMQGNLIGKEAGLQEGEVVVGGGDFATSYGTPEQAIDTASTMVASSQMMMKDILADAMPDFFAEKKAKTEEEAGKTPEDLEKARMEEEAALQEKIKADMMSFEEKQNKENEKKQKAIAEMQAELTAKETVKEQERQKTKDFFAALKESTGLNLSDLEKTALDSGVSSINSKLYERIASGNKMNEAMPAISSMSPSTYAHFLFKGASPGTLPSGPGMPPIETPKDFILSGDRYIEPSSKDTVIGFMPGGPVDQAINVKGSKSTSGGNNIYFNINGGDPQEVYNTIMKVLTTLGIA